MIYLVSKQDRFKDIKEFKLISAQDSIDLMTNWKLVQFDSETTGRDAHINDFLCTQFGNDADDAQIVVDTTTIDINLYKEILESRLVIGQNLKFDLQFLYNYGIVPLQVYDTMIVEQLLNLGRSNKSDDPDYVGMGLAAIAKRRIGVDIDKSIRGDIQWRGLDNDVIRYAAGDVTYLEKIMWSQVADYKRLNCKKAAKLECDFVPVIAYMEWCGIKLDINKWLQKMAKDQQHLDESIVALNNFVVENPQLKEFTTINYEGDLWSGFDLTPKCEINWASSGQVIPIAKKLGFDVNETKKGKTGESVSEKHLKKQKGINDEFLKLYFGKGEPDDDDYFAGYSGSAKVVSSFGQTQIDAINPNTGRIHTSYKQLGADTSRMSCGSKQSNTDLAKLKHLPAERCKYPNMQQLPHDAETRACFVPEPGNLWVSCDYSAIESRLGADIYKEQSMIDEFLHGSGDMHSLVAKMIFPELKDIPVKEIKDKFPHLRSKAKPVEFSQQFGGSAFAIQNSMGCNKEEAEAFATAYAKGFPRIAKFKAEGSKFVRSHGYIELCPITGHKTWWFGWQNWLHSPIPDNSIAAKWDRKALNSVTQGTGAIILKDSQIEVFHWVVEHGYFGKILLCNLTHDEANWEFPKEIEEFPKVLEDLMEKSAAKYCKSLPIPAVAEVGEYWKH